MVAFKKKDKSKERYKSVRKLKNNQFLARKGLRQQIVPFTRTMQISGSLRTLTTAAGGAWIETVPTVPPAPGDVPGLVKTMVFNMNMLPGIQADIPHLFKMYKLTGVRMEIIPATNTTYYGVGIGNKGLLLRARPNRTGTILTNADKVEDWNQNQAVKKWIIPQNKTKILYMKLNHLDYTYRGNPLNPPGNFSYSVKPATWVETRDLGCEHYGLDLRIDSIAGDTIANYYDGTENPMFTILYKYYFQCKGVK